MCECSRRRFLGSAVTSGLAASAVTARAEGRKPPVTCLAYAPDGNHLVVGSQAGVSILDSESLAQVDSLSVFMSQVNDVRFSPDGTWLVAAGGDPAEIGVIEWYQWPGRQLLSRASFGRDSLHSVSTAAGGERCLTASLDGHAYLSHIEDRSPTIRYDGHSTAVLAGCFLPGGDTAVTAGRDRTLRVWNTRNGETLRTMHTHTDTVNALRVRPRGDGLPMVASVSADRTVRFWQPTIGRMVRFVRLPSRPLDAAWIDSGEQILVPCADGKVRRIAAASVQILETLDAFDGWAYAIDSDPTGGRAAVGGTDGDVRILRW